jgi:CDGSH-type Zn-finger protein
MAVGHRAPGKENLMSDTGAGEPATLIIPYQDGPLIIRGDFRIQAWDGTPIPAGRQTVALCRCGRSALKPFCDGSHARAGFRTARRRQQGPHEDSAEA